MIATWVPNLTKYVDPLRDCYEAYVLYCFVALLEAYLKVERKKLDERFRGKIVGHFFPFCCLKPMSVGRSFFRTMETCVIQYMILKPVLAVVQLVLTICERYEGGVFDYSRGYTYVVLLTNVSQTTALYALIYIYHAIHNCPEMDGRHLLGKFLVIKAVVFFAFWQSCLFSLLVYLEVIKETSDMSADVRAASIDDFVLTLEMVVIAILHHRVFSYFEYRAIAEPAMHVLKTQGGLGWRRVVEDADDVKESLPLEYKDMTEEELEAAASLERRARKKGMKRNAMIDVVNVRDVTDDIRHHLLPRKASRPLTKSVSLAESPSTQTTALDREENATRNQNQTYTPPDIEGKDDEA